MRNYEILWILGGETTDADGVASIDRTKALINSHQGVVHRAEFWGRRTLSYPIKQNREGAYYVARFSVEPAGADEIGKGVASDQAVIRHMIVRVEEIEDAAPPAPPAARQEPSAQQPASAAPAQ